MTQKNFTRKHNIVTKMNFDEFTLLTRAFDDANYKTMGNFCRDMILVGISPSRTQQFDIPEFNKQVADDLRASLQNLNMIIGHLNLAIEDNKKHSNITERDKYLSEAMECVHFTAQASMVWSDFFSGKYSRVIENIALKMLSVDSLEKLVCLRKKFDETNI
jgi:hypothetical protein